MMVQEKELARREAATIERDREQAISAQRLEQRHAEQDAAMALARDQLAKREQVIAARENALEPREAAIQQQASAAREIEAAAEEREQAQRDWMTVVSGSADGSLIGSLRDDGYFHMARQIDGRSRPAPDAVKRTIAKRPPEWAATMLKLIDRTFRDQADTSIRIMKLNDEVDALDDLVEQTRKSLPQNQQQIFNGTDEALKEVAERLRRMEAIQSQQRSL